MLVTNRKLLNYYDETKHRKENSSDYLMFQKTIDKALEVLEPLAQSALTRYDNLLKKYFKVENNVVVTYKDDNGEEKEVLLEGMKYEDYAKEKK